jgi:hypothetical protein
MRPIVCAAVVTAALALPSFAEAHIALMSPAPRYADQKVGPCGRLNGARSTNVATFRPGETITITWRETIDHPGHFRISFDADGDDDFVDPASYDDRNTNEAVLLDGIPDRSGGGEYSVQVRLPTVTCTNCTLQVIQVMTDKPPYVAGSNDIYYQCADLVLSGEPVDGGPIAGGSDAGFLAPERGCVCVKSSHESAAWLLIFGCIALRLRR